MTITIEQPICGPDDVRAAEQAMPWSDRLNVDSLYELIAATAADHPQKTAISYLATGRMDEKPIQWTYQQLIGRINQTANLFHTLGVGASDVVSFLLPNLPQTQFVMWGGAATGIVNPINFLLSADQISELLRTAKTKVLVALGPHPQLDIWQKVNALRDRVPTLETVLQVGPPDSESDVLNFDVEIVKQPDDRLLSGRIIGRGDQAIFFHTGGTTGSPKLAPHTHGNDLYCAWAVAHFGDFSPGGQIIHILPMFHVAGSIVVSLTALATGMALTILTPLGLRHPIGLKNYWKLIARHRPTHIGGVPTNLVAAMNVALDGADIDSVNYAVTGGSSLPIEVERAWKRVTGIPLSQIYGMTEAGSTVVMSPVKGEVKLGSAGIRLPYSQWAIVGSDGETLGPDESGSIMFKSPSVFPGYLNAAHNQGTLTEDGWVVTGDLGYVDDDGYLFITGRVKDMIIRSAHNIDPSIIEETLLQHRAVALAAAIGRPDPYAGEVPVAYVQLNPGQQATADELLSFTAEHIVERPALPKEIIVLDNMPLTAVGKIFKPLLRWQQTQSVLQDTLAPVSQKGVEVSVSVGEDRHFGMLAKVEVGLESMGQRDEIETEIEILLDQFNVKYRLIWTGY